MLNMSRWLRRIKDEHLPFREHQVSSPTAPCEKGLALMKSSGLVLEKVCEYFYYNQKYKDSKDVPDMDFPTELSLELLMAADYLDGTLIPLLMISFFSLTQTSVRQGRHGLTLQRGVRRNPLK